jgi:hypothetical protein
MEDTPRGVYIAFNLKGMFLDYACPPFGRQKKNINVVSLLGPFSTKRFDDR